MPEFVLHVKDIDDAGKDYAFAVSQAWMQQVLGDTDLRPGGQDDGQLRLHAQANGLEILVTGHLRAGLQTDCVRCLAPVPVDVDAPFTALMVPTGARNLPPELELTAEDLDLATYEGSDIVLDDIVREYLVLEAPMQAHCAAPCEPVQVPERLRPPADVFGGPDTAVDPRLAPLLKLKTELPDTKE